ncbi:MAG: hypothetical protein GY941_21490 [Planctomycetes bacterium]|nr:hypothetical protein [Planctomycetota bacterium]
MEGMTFVHQCGDNHDEIRYLADECPVCKVVREFEAIVNELQRIVAVEKRRN